VRLSPDVQLLPLSALEEKEASLVCLVVEAFVRRRPLGDGPRRLRVRRRLEGELEVLAIP
jgi:hypothetical protein